MQIYRFCLTNNAPHVARHTDFQQRKTQAPDKLAHIQLQKFLMKTWSQWESLRFSRKIDLKIIGSTYHLGIDSLF